MVTCYLSFYSYDFLCIMRIKNNYLMFSTLTVFVRVILPLCQQFNVFGANIYGYLHIEFVRIAHFQIASNRTFQCSVLCFQQLFQFWTCSVEQFDQCFFHCLHCFFTVGLFNTLHFNTCQHTGASTTFKYFKVKITLM